MLPFGAFCVVSVWQQLAAEAEEQRAVLVCGSVQDTYVFVSPFFCRPRTSGLCSPGLVTGGRGLFGAPRHQNSSSALDSNS